MKTDILFLVGFSFSDSDSDDELDDSELEEEEDWEPEPDFDDGDCAGFLFFWTSFTGDATTFAFSTFEAVAGAGFAVRGGGDGDDDFRFDCRSGSTPRFGATGADTFCRSSLDDSLLLYRFLSFWSSDESLDFFRASFSLRCEVGRGGGDGDRLDDELVDGERALDFGFAGFLLGSGDDDDEEEEGGERVLTGSFFRALIGLRLCRGDGERRRSRRFDAEFGFDLS